jgi:uncharacterized protein
VGGQASPTTGPGRATATGADPALVRAAVARAAGAAGPGDVEIRETHISWLFLAGDRVYKLKKPVVLNFLDYGTPERRRIMCAQEIRLNSRLAPGVYLGVRGLAAGDDGLDIVADDDPAAVDYVVEMRRYDEDRTLAVLVAREQVDDRQLDDVGTALAGFHRTCPPACRRDGAAAARHEIHDNLAELSDLLPDRRFTLGGLARFLDAFVLAHAPMLDARSASGHVREGHGDLRAEHVILDAKLAFVDCVEFDRSLRTIDAADDLAFLVMDLCARGAEPLGRRVIDAYRAAGGDCGPDELVWFYATHRALVRAKVALLRAAPQDGTRASGATVPRAADELFAVAERSAWRARGPMALVICGAAASGKSQLAATVAARFAVPVINSDIVRKQLAGLHPTQRAPTELYDTEINHRTYGELGRQTARAIADRHSVLVDATCRHRADRDTLMAELADPTPVWFVECMAPAEVRIARAAAREHDPAHVSDATAELVRDEHNAFDPLDEIAPDRHLALRTDRRTPGVLADLLALLDARLADERADRSIRLRV